MISFYESNDFDDYIDFEDPDYEGIVNEYVHFISCHSVKDEKLGVAPSKYLCTADYKSAKNALGMQIYVHHGPKALYKNYKASDLTSDQGFCSYQIILFCLSIFY